MPDKGVNVVGPQYNGLDDCLLGALEHQIRKILDKAVAAHGDPNSKYNDIPNHAMKVAACAGAETVDPLTIAMDSAFGKYVAAGWMAGLIDADDWTDESVVT